MGFQAVQVLLSSFFQAIHQQLQEALEEQESLKVQTAEYARQVARVEELLAQKVSCTFVHLIEETQWCLVLLPNRSNASFLTIKE